MDSSDNIQEILSQLINFHNIAYDAMSIIVFVDPFLIGVKNDLDFLRKQWESLYRYVDIGIHSKWSEFIGATHLEYVRVKFPIYDSDIYSQGGSDGNNNGGHNVYVDIDDVIKGYKYEFRFVNVAERHDGIIPVSDAYIPGISCFKRQVEGVNHLEMGSHESMCTEILESIEKFEKNEKPIIIISPFE